MGKGQGRGAGTGAAKQQANAARAEAVGHINVMFVVSRRQRDALQGAALRLREETGGRGRLDASRVLRAVLADWIEAGAPIPKRALEDE